MHDEHAEVDMDANLERSQKRADSGEYWYLWILVPGLLALVLWLFWGARGIGLGVITGIAILLYLLVVRTGIGAAIVFACWALAMFVYFLLVYQTV